VVEDSFHVVRLFLIEFIKSKNYLCLGFDSSTQNIKVAD